MNFYNKSSPNDKRSKPAIIISDHKQLKKCGFEIGDELMIKYKSSEIIINKAHNKFNPYAKSK